ncbi:MAG TPA: plasmid pRiA4b ORF-3 family protein [Streptosporangiaceae bacterium]
MIMEVQTPGGGGAILRSLDGQTFVGGKRVAKRAVPKLPKNAATTIHRVKVTLYGSKPPIWRRLELPSTITLDRLHQVLQIAFDWDGFHLHVFETPSGDFGDPEQNDGWTEYKDEGKVAIAQVATAAKAKIVYVYDFGDDHRHDVVVEAIAPAAPGVAYPRCTAGRREMPLEDVDDMDPADTGPPDSGPFSTDDLTNALSRLADVIVPADGMQNPGPPARHIGRVLTSEDVASLWDDE